ncbi:hypothetical protein IKQ26_07440 [bacterium]|nr:hypothetical protein [bacterium]
MKLQSFGATLKVDEKLYKNLPSDAPEGYVEDIIEKYKNFIDNPKISKLLGEDTIELSRAKMRGYNGYSVALKISSPNSDDVFEGGIFTNKKDVSYFRFVELSRQTYQYIFSKFGVPEKFNRFWYMATHKK